MTIAHSSEKNIDDRRASTTHPQYPNCIVDDLHPYNNNPKFLHLGDGICDNFKDSGDFNSIECGYDDGDCIEFNFNYPNCTAEFTRLMGDGFCSGGEYNTVECGFDGGDCIEFNAKYPNCNVYYPSEIGDGKCDSFNYNTEECGWDGGDCLIAKYPDCHVDWPSKLGDGFCNNYEPYNTTECGFDLGDCKCSGLGCYSAEAKVGIVIAVLFIGIGLCYIGSRRQKAKVEKEASLAQKDTSVHLPQPV